MKNQKDFFGCSDYSKRALDVFKSAELAKKWLKEDAYGLGDIPPLEYAATEIGGREVEDLLGRN